METEYITPTYKTIDATQKRELLSLMNSTLIHGFSEQDYYDVLAAIRRVVERLTEQEEE